MVVTLKNLFKGLLTYIPGVSYIKSRRGGGTDSARYCYSVWLRHLVMADKCGLNSNPEVVAELGPGFSLGMGLAALLSGSNKYFAFDVVKHAEVQQNLKVLDELVELFSKKEPIPDSKEFPHIKPYLDDYSFPADILTEDRLEYCLNEDRVDEIRKSLRKTDNDESMIQYKAPWSDHEVLEDGTVEMIFSQAVLEHIDALSDSYNAMYKWLKNGGYISHQIDFKCHGTASEWNGHWQYSDFVWKIIKGRRPYLINRQPHSRHIILIKDVGFEILRDEQIRSRSNLRASDLAYRFGDVDDDLTISGAFIQAYKSA